VADLFPTASVRLWLSARRSEGGHFRSFERSRSHGRPHPRHVGSVDATTIEPLFPIVGADRRIDLGPPVLAVPPERAEPAPPPVAPVPAMPAVRPVPGVPPVELVVPPVVVVAPRLPLLVHPPVLTVSRRMDATVSATKTQRTRFDMLPPVACDAGAMDALSTTRKSVPPNSRQENSAVGGCQQERRHPTYHHAGPRTDRLRPVGRGIRTTTALVGLGPGCYRHIRD